MALQNNPNNAPMPSRETLVLALLSEELKSRRFFNTLMELGMDHSWFRPHLDELILTCVGLNDERNETMDFFYSLMDAHAAQIGIKEESVKEQALLVYEKLTSFRASKEKQ